jgi:putative ABC transport system ATP-binding protein
MPILRIEQLTKRHPAGNRPFLFAQVNAHIDAQDTIAVVGASGQGKSTLLRILARLATADEGRLSLHGKPVAEIPPTEWRRRVCYVPQAPVMLPGTVEDNLMVVSKLHQTAFDRALAQRLMEGVGLGETDWRKPAADLSGGEKQRIQLVRSLLLRSEILLLDEITSSLDEESKRCVETLLTEWNRGEGTAYVWITHDREQSDSVGRRLWELSGGTLHERAVTETAEGDAR